MDKAESKRYLLELINRIKTGDTEAREEFVLYLTPHLKKIGSKLRISAADLQSSLNWVLTKILNNIEKLDYQKNILSYITNSVRNYCIDEYRKTCVRQRKEGYIKYVNSSRTNLLEPSIEFMIENVCKDNQEEAILKKIVFEKSSIEIVAKETKTSIKKIKTLLDRVKSELS